MSKEIAFINKAWLEIEDHSPNVLSLWIDVMLPKRGGTLLIQSFEALEPLFREFGVTTLGDLAGRPIWVDVDSETELDLYTYAGPVEGVKAR